MNYSELLNTDEWKNKRREILERDSNTCQRCGINSDNFISSSKIIFSENLNFEILRLKKEILPYDIIILKENKKTFYGKTYLKIDKDNFISNNYSLTANVVAKEIYNNNESALSKVGMNPVINVFKSHRLNKPRINGFKSKNPRQIDFNKYDIDLDGFWFIKNKEFDLFKKSKQLHVHHNCYRKGMEIWEQPDSDYITLCNVCHKIVHEYYFIPFFNINGEIIQFLNFCDRCNGYGHIPCYSYINGGICYKCNGAGTLN